MLVDPETLLIMKYLTGISRLLCSATSDPYSTLSTFHGFFSFSLLYTLQAQFLALHDGLMKMEIFRLQPSDSKTLLYTSFIDLPKLIDQCVMDGCSPSNLLSQYTRQSTIYYGYMYSAPFCRLALNRDRRAAT